MSPYSEDHIRLLRALLDNDVKFILIGGHAAIYYGVNRNTGDLDILIEPTAINGRRLIDALRQIGLEVPDISLEEFEKKLVLSFGFEPDAVDILNYTPGIDFVDAYNNSVEANFSELYDVEVLKRILNRKEAGN